MLDYGWRAISGLQQQRFKSEGRNCPYSATNTMNFSDSTAESNDSAVLFKMVAFAWKIVDFKTGILYIVSINCLICRNVERFCAVIVENGIYKISKGVIMLHTFVSYSRQNQTTVKTLINDIETLGHEVWFDQELSGGHVWWDQVLEKIRECDLFIFALAPEALDSFACKLECNYAFQLHKTILPIVVTDDVPIDLLPPLLSKIQNIDYRSQDKQSLFALIRALNNLPAPKPLPEPLPEPPEAPISYLGDLKEQIISTATLSFQDQTAILFKLKEQLNYDNEVDDVLNLLRLLSNREDLYAKIAKEIESLTAHSAAQKTDVKQSSLTNFELSREETELNFQTTLNKKPHEHKEWSAELISQGDRERIIRVRLSQDEHIIKYRLIVKQLSQNEDIVEVDGVVVAQGRSLFSAGGVFNFPVNDATRQYPATVDVRTSWADLKIHSFRLNISDHILYSEGSTQI